jgi:hypothetical protein
MRREPGFAPFPSAVILINGTIRKESAMDIMDQVLGMLRNVMGGENFQKADDGVKTEKFYEEMKARLEKEFGPGEAREKPEGGAAAGGAKLGDNPIVEGILRGFEEVLKKCRDLPSLEDAAKDFLTKLEAAAKIFRG